MIRIALIFSVLVCGNALSRKRGTTGTFKNTFCKDAERLNLQSNWYYNWTPIPRFDCENGFAAEFVPMISKCPDDNCKAFLPKGFRKLWKKAGVRFIAGFNEPEKEDQANLTPEKAAELWPQIHRLAVSFDPPLRIVGPSMAKWGNDGGSEWLDTFLSLIPERMRAKIEFLGQHDYSGNPNVIVKRSKAAFKKYKRKIWLTEFAVGFGLPRRNNDYFMKRVLPVLDSERTVFRYAWYSMRNQPRPWVDESSLFPYRKFDSDSTVTFMNNEHVQEVMTSTGKLYATM
ncbi:glycosyl hydrolase [Tetraselmis virus 1]|uniref:Glycosyl hydrolase n=1 Tax=Tetraselmis virus 1 TaxID=2060617 RepID=A0A2P0VP73_9VIRU|nr:glycosyl hydrolase [Tetraselmis virus 1]AUF82697.1 glycosyl hydrolase [Tetraselmis virus 1]